MKYLKLYNNSEEAIMNDGETNIFVINGSNGVGMDTPSFLNVEFGFANNTNICSLEFLSGACTNILVEGQYFSKQDLIDSAENYIISLPSEYLNHNVNVSFQIKNHVMGEDDIYDNALHINGTPNSLYSVNLYGHRNLLSISVPKGTKEISLFACKALTSVTFNDDDIILNEGAFWGCGSLEEITLPIKIKEIPNELFRGCVSLYYINEFQLKDVETIGEYAFFNCQNLVLDLDGFTSLKAISGNAFERCYSLEKWRLPSSLERLPNSGFGEKNSLSEIILNGTITELSDRCLSNLSAITELYIPDNVQSISIGAFDNDSSLNYIKIDGTPIFDDSMYSATTNIPLSGQLDCNVETYLNFTQFLPSGWSSSIIYINKDGISGVSYYKNDINTDVINVYWPIGATEIPSAKFSWCTSLSSITIPNSVNSIGESAFWQCHELSSIVIPSGVTSIGNNVFAYCDSLTSITVENGNPNYDSRDNCNALIETSTNTLFRGCSTTVIPNSVATIGNRAFSYCTSLSSIMLPSCVTSIGDYAFGYCYELSNIIIPNSVTHIGNNAFNSCNSLSSITLPSGLTSIGNYTFNNCTSLTSVTIPDGVTSIGEYTFYSCNSLSNITLPSGLTSIGNYTFCYCNSLSNITIPNSVTTIGYLAFHGCSSLTSITLSSGLTSIGNYTFQNCKSLSSITLPSGLTSIGYGVFNGCNSLTSITLSSGLTSIGEGVFYGCSSLSSITIPNSVTSIGNNAFDRCTSLTNITLPSGLTSIGFGVFIDCSSLANITLPSGLTSIGKQAFINCSSLASVTIPDGVTKIDDAAFDECASLSSITLSSGLTSIGKHAFWGCSSLSSITIPDGVTSIGDGAFQNCIKLNKIIYRGSNIISINSYTFYRVSNNGTLICEDTDAANHILQYLPSGWVVQTS